MPDLEGGQLVAVFFVNSAEVRAWSADDLAFIKEIGQRTVGWIERFMKTAALRESEARLLAAPEAAQLGIWDLDLRSEELVASAHCKANFGRDRSQAFTYPQLLAAVHPDDLSRMRSAVAHTVATGDPYRIEYRIIRPDGQLAWVRISGRLIRDNEGRRAAGAGIGPVE